MPTGPDGDILELLGGIVWDERAHRIRRDIAALAASGLGVSELHAEAIRLTSREVRSDLTCWAAIDPETLVISTMVSGETRVAQEYEPRLAEAEYSATEPQTFAALAREHRTVVRLSDWPDHERRRCSRLNHVWRPLGLDREVRVLFMADGACWGAAGLVRAGKDFDDRETELLAAVAPAIAAATRVAVRCEVGSAAGGTPAIVVVGAGGELRAATAAAREWQERLDEIAPARFTVMMQVMAIGGRAAAPGGFRTRIRDGRGQWAVLQASQLIGGEDGQIAITIEPVGGDQLTGLLLEAYGLTARERNICREVIAGHPTAEVADRLFISANTVQDHLKSVFNKVGVRSRGELVATLRPAGSRTSGPAAAVCEP